MERRAVRVLLGLLALGMALGMLGLRLGGPGAVRVMPLCGLRSCRIANAERSGDPEGRDNRSDQGPAHHNYPPL